MTGIFNVRVYGILLTSEGKVLVADEYVFGRNITKFPGGGLQFGEGTRQCLLREFREELNVDVSVKNHFYTTDFFQLSAFHKNQQIISIYYIIETTSPESLPVSQQVFDFPELKDGEISFRWLDLKTVGPDSVTFPIDQKVLGMLQNYFNGL